MSFGIWNNLDELGLYMALERLSYETDEEYFNRIKQFAIYKYKTDYYTQVHSIPLQLGLETYEAIRLSCLYPFECKVDWEYVYFENFPPAGAEGSKEYIRVFINTHDTTIQKILNALDTSSTFGYTILKSKYKRLPCKFLIRNSNIGTGRDFVNTKYTQLSNPDILDGSFVSEDTSSCKKNVSSLQDLKKSGDFYLDNKLGYLQTLDDIDLGFFVTYKYYKPYFSIEATELNLTPLNILAKYGLTDQLSEYTKIILENRVWGK